MTLANNFVTFALTNSQMILMSLSWLHYMYSIYNYQKDFTEFSDFRSFKNVYVVTFDLQPLYNEEEGFQHPFTETDQNFQTPFKLMNQVWQHKDQELPALAFADKLYLFCRYRNNELGKQRIVILEMSQRFDSILEPGRKQLCFCFTYSRNKKYFCDKSYVYFKEKKENENFDLLHEITYEWYLMNNALETKNSKQNLWDNIYCNNNLIWNLMKKQT